MTDALKLGFGPFAAPAKAGNRAFWWCSATMASNSAPPPRKALGSAAGLVGAGRQGRALHRQERLGA